MNAFADYAPTVGLIFFFGVFVWIAVSTYRPSMKSKIQSHAFIPLKEDTNDGQ